jgi:hypothetical protein
MVAIGKFNKFALAAAREYISGGVWQPKANRLLSECVAVVSVLDKENLINRSHPRFRGLIGDSAT